MHRTTFVVEITLININLSQRKLDYENIQFLSPPSYQSLLIEQYFNDTKLASGTAFVVKASQLTVLVTARHNVTGRDNEGKPLGAHGGVPNKIIIWHNKKNCLGDNIPIHYSLLTLEEQPLWYEHPTLGKKADIAALKLINLDEIDLYPYDLNEHSELLLPRPSDNISVVGFPFGLTAGKKLAIWTTGFVVSEPNIDFDGLPVFLIDSRTRPCQSGSAVISQHNEGIKTYADDGSREMGWEPYTHFVGVYTGRVNDKSDLGFVWKKSAILELVNSIS